LRREFLVDGSTAELRIALLEDGQPAELSIERPQGAGAAGNIYKGRVSAVLPGMQAAFVDVGLERDAFLYVEDAVPTPDAAPPVDAGPPVDADHPGPPRIEDLLREGDEILVQVTRDALPNKGARITRHPSLPGRLLVLVPSQRDVAVSRRIADAAERDRLKAQVREAALAAGVTGGFIVRTAGAGLAPDAFAAEARTLWERWRAIRDRAAAGAAPALLHREPGLVDRLLRDQLGEDVAAILVAGDEVHGEVTAIVGRTLPSLLPRVRLWEGPGPLFAAHGLEGQIEKALRARVWLRSGGSIVIHPTEALVAVDVNTGKYVGRRHPEETILRTNLEAAAEIVRQIRLRDLGGIIVVDFIDMEREESRAAVAAALEAELRKDRARSRMLQISAFGLVEITRQRSRPSLERLLCVPCPRCHGSGRVKSPETIYFEVLRAVRALAPRAGGTVVVRAHPEVAAFLRRERGALESAAAGARLDLVEDSGLALDGYAVTA
jgi:ribonuclease G